MSDPDRIPQLGRADVVATLGAAWAELAIRDGFARAMANTFAKSGITNKLDGSADDQLSSEVRAILTKDASMWGEQQCNFFEWRSKFMSSYEPSRPAGISAVISSLGNPFSRAGRERFARSFLREAEVGQDMEDGAIEAKDAGHPPHAGGG